MYEGEDIPEGIFSEAFPTPPEASIVVLNRFFINGPPFLWTLSMIELKDMNWVPFDE